MRTADNFKPLKLTTGVRLLMADGRAITEPTYRSSPSDVVDVAGQVSAWLDANPTHPRWKDGKFWMDRLENQCHYGEPRNAATAERRSGKGMHESNFERLRKQRTHDTNDEEAMASISVLARCDCGRQFEVHPEASGNDPYSVLWFRRSFRSVPCFRQKLWQLSRKRKLKLTRIGPPRF